MAWRCGLLPLDYPTHRWFAHRSTPSRPRRRRGAVFSSVTLTLIGAFNLATVGPQFRAWRRAANKEQREHHHNHNAELIDEGEQVSVEVTGGLFARCGCCKRLLASVDAAWKMYFVGVLFGLGFETASEVGLLALAAVGPKDVPAPLVMLLPALFTSGMALVDTCDGLLVLFTFAKGNDDDAAGALLFGALLTAASAAASLAIGSIVGLGLVAPFLPPRVAGPLVALSDALGRHDGRGPRGRRHVRGCVGAVHGGAGRHRVARRSWRPAVRCGKTRRPLRGDRHLTAIRFRSGSVKQAAGVTMPSTARVLRRTRIAGNDSAPASARRGGSASFSRLWNRGGRSRRGTPRDESSLSQKGRRRARPRCALCGVRQRHALRLFPRPVAPLVRQYVLAALVDSLLCSESPKRGQDDARARSSRFFSLRFFSASSSSESEARSSPPSDAPSSSASPSMPVGSMSGLSRKGKSSPT